MASTSNASNPTNFNWNQQKPNETFYSNINLSGNFNGLPNNSNVLIKNMPNVQESVITQNDPMLYNSGFASNPTNSTGNPNIITAPNNNYGFEDAEQDNPFVNIVMKTEPAESTNYNTKYYDPANSGYPGCYNNGVNLLQSSGESPFCI